MSSYFNLLRVPFSFRDARALASSYPALSIPPDNLRNHHSSHPGMMTPGEQVSDASIKVVSRPWKFF